MKKIIIIIVFLFVLSKINATENKIYFEFIPGFSYIPSTNTLQNGIYTRQNEFFSSNFGFLFGWERTLLDIMGFMVDFGYNRWNYSKIENKYDIMNIGLGFSFDFGRRLFKRDNIISKAVFKLDTSIFNFDSLGFFGIIGLNFGWFLNNSFAIYIGVELNSPLLFLFDDPKELRNLRFNFPVGITYSIGKEKRVQLQIEKERQRQIEENRRREEAEQRRILQNEENEKLAREKGFNSYAEYSQFLQREEIREARERGFSNVNEYRAEKFYLAAVEKFIELNNITTQQYEQIKLNAHNIALNRVNDSFFMHQIINSGNNPILPLGRNAIDILLNAEIMYSLAKMWIGVRFGPQYAERNNLTEHLLLRISWELNTIGRVR